MAGAAVASVAASGAAAASGEEKDPTVSLQDGDELAGVLDSISDGETVVLPRGTYKLTRDVSINADRFTFHGNGSTVETYGRRDVHIDGVGWDFGYLDVKPQNQSNPDAWCRFRPKGDQWRFHHVAWTRRNDTRYINGDNRRLSHLLPGVRAGGSAEISDCWLGHGSHLDHGKSALKAWGIMDGELWVRRCFFRQTGVYGANSSKDYVRNEGVVNFESCYFENCYNGCVRTGSHYDAAYVRNCVMNASDRSKTPTRENHGSGGPYNRGVWAFHGPVHVENTHITSFDRALDVSVNHDIRRTPSIKFHSGAYDGRVKNSHRVTIDSTVGSNPRTSPPDECVTSPEEAYLGSEDGGSTEEQTDPHEHTLSIEGTGDPANYVFSVSEGLTPIEDSVEKWDAVSETDANGWVTDTAHRDAFGFDGEVTEFEFVRGEANVYLDGEVVDPATLGADGPDGRTLTIKGKGEATNYAFSVSESLEAASDDALQPWDELSETSASGWVTRPENEDSFVFQGEITAFAFERGDARVFLDGEEVDPATLGADEPVEHTLTIKGKGEATNYAFGVSESLEAASDDALQPWDELSGTSASGWVTRPENEDSFVFQGEITDFEFVRGDARVFLDGEEVTPDSLL